MEDKVTKTTKWMNLVRSVAGLILVICVFVWNMPKTVNANVAPAKNSWHGPIGDSKFPDLSKIDYTIDDICFNGEGSDVWAYIIIGNGNTYCVKFENGEKSAEFKSIQRAFSDMNINMVRDMKLIVGKKLTEYQQKLVMDMCGKIAPLGCEIKDYSEFMSGLLQP